MGTLPSGGTLLGTLASGRAIYSVPAFAGYEVWGTDGTADGAEALFDYFASLSDPGPVLINILGGNAIVLTKSNWNYGLRATDGTAAGTHDILNLAASSPDSGIGLAAVVNGRDIFYTHDGDSYTFYGTDGTAAGTQELFHSTFDFAPSVQVLSSSTTAATLAIWGSGGQVRIYETDGTTAGTVSTYSSPLNYQGGSDAAALSLAIADFWAFAFGGPFLPPAWTGISSDWVGPSVTFIGPPPGWSYGGFWGTLYPNWANGLLPAAGNDLTIDQPGVLNANVGVTIHSLTVGSSSVLNVTGSFSVATSLVNQGVIYVSGALQVGGTISVGNGAVFGLIGGSLVGGTLASTGSGQIYSTGGTNLSLINVTIAAGSTFNVASGADFRLSSGTITNNGVLALAAGTAGSPTRVNTSVASVNSYLMLTGSGVISLVGTAASGDSFYGAATDYTTIDTGQTIMGSGIVSSLTNLGTIIANRSDALAVSNIANSGTLLATAGGTMVVAAITSTDGSIIADNGTVSIGYSTGGVVRLQNAGRVALLNSTTSGIAVDFASGASDTLEMTPQGTNISVPITGLNVGDRIELVGISIASASVSSAGTITLAEAGGGNRVFTSIAFDIGAPQMLRTGHDDASGNDYIEVACFAEGTPIHTDRGTIPVERLCTGDLVLSVFGGTVPVVWTGHRALRPSRHPNPDALNPILIRAGAFALNVPNQDLWLSPDHALYIEGLLVPASCLVNGSSILQLPVRAITYWHVELPQHDVLLAANTPCESYLDANNRHAFEDAPVVALHPCFESPEAAWLAQACAPQCRGGPRLDAIRSRIAARAAKSAVAHRFSIVP